MVRNLDSIHINPNPDQANFGVDMQFFVTPAIVFFMYQDFSHHDFVFNSLFFETLT